MSSCSGNTIRSVKRKASVVERQPTRHNPPRAVKKVRPDPPPCLPEGRPSRQPTPNKVRPVRRTAGTAVGTTKGHHVEKTNINNDIISQIGTRKLVVDLVRLDEEKVVETRDTRNLREKKSTRVRKKAGSNPLSKRNSRQVLGSKSGDSVVKKYGVMVQNPPKDDDCCICCEKLTDVSGYTNDDATVCKLRRCGHMYHWSCLQAMYDSGTKDGSLQCPTCKTIYGEKCGNCPSGQMQVTKMPQSLPSYSCGTLRVEYYISAGIQGPEHPNPGQQYSARGFPRYGYLPDNERGSKLVKMLMMAWERRLTFTIGTSVTTGEVGTVVWNEIHHKTEFGSNRSGHGYPDPNYMDNLTMELGLQGVTEDQLNT